MRKLILSAAVATATLWASAALPCGGGFGEGLSIDPSQKIVVKHEGGVETYIFRPHFCGRAAQFGLILPIPGQLSANPELAEAKLFDELETFTAPKVEKVTKCFGEGPDAGAGGGSDGDASNGVDVIDAGQVGIFDWALLQADSSAAFTDWLSANAFPYDPTAAQHFNYYVAKGWYFVAFKVTAGADAPPAGKELCGDLGPLSLSFHATEAVVPARIAAVDTTNPYMFGWQVFGVSSSYMRTDTSNVYPTLKFAGPFSAADQAQYPEIAKLAAGGDKITKLNIGFYGSEITTDISLVPNAQQTEFRDTAYEVTYVDCDGGAGAGGSGTGGAGGAAGTGGNGGTGGSSVSGGTGGGAAGESAAPAASTEGGDDDGGCSIAARHGRVGLGLGLAALALGMMGLRRRRS